MQRREFIHTAARRQCRALLLTGGFTSAAEQKEKDKEKRSPPLLRFDAANEIVRGDTLPEAR